MTYNLSLMNNVTDIGKAASFLNIHSGGFLGILFIVVLVIIIIIFALKNNMRDFKAVFFALAITLIPTVLLSLINELGSPLIPAWYVILHITLAALAGVFTYMNK